MEQLRSDQNVLMYLVAPDGYPSRDEMLKDIMHRAALLESGDAPRPCYTLHDIERALATHNAEVGISRPSYYKTFLYEH